MNDKMNTTKCVPNGQTFHQLDMLERGLYATFVTIPNAINEYSQLMREYSPHAVMNAINAVVSDGFFRAETNSRPTRYAPVTPSNDTIIQACFDAYHELRDPSWTKHKILTRTMKKSLKAFIAQVGEKNAVPVFRRGIKAQADGWAKGKNVDLVNLLTNDKVIRFAEQVDDDPYTPGMVYRLAVSKPDPRLREASSYAVRLDQRSNGTVEGYVFPEGEPSEGVTITVPTSALVTPLKSWGAYTRQFS